MYDPALNEWTGIQSMPALPALKYVFGVVNFKGDMFVLGKWTEDSSHITCGYLKIYNVDNSGMAERILKWGG